MILCSTRTGILFPRSHLDVLVLHLRGPYVAQCCFHPQRSPRCATLSWKGALAVLRVTAAGPWQLLTVVSQQPAHTCCWNWQTSSRLQLPLPRGSVSPGRTCGLFGVPLLTGLSGAPLLPSLSAYMPAFSWLVFCGRDEGRTKDGGSQVPEIGMMFPPLGLEGTGASGIL